MARSDKSKSNPLKKKTRARKSGEVSAPAESTGQTVSGTPAQFQSEQPAAETKKRDARRRQVEEEPLVDLRESEESLDHTFSPSTTSNGYQDINDDSAAHRRIAERAFMVYQEHGCEHGNDWAHWFEAERQIRAT